MHGIQGNICLDQPHQPPCNKILVIYLLNRTENKGMMGKKKIRLFTNGCIYNLIRGIQGNVYLFYLLIASSR